MKRLTRRDPNTGQVYSKTDDASLRDRLAWYEEAEERGEIMAVGEAERKFILSMRLISPEKRTALLAKLAEYAEGGRSRA